MLGNVRVMSEMLTEMTPGQEAPDDLDLLQVTQRLNNSSGIPTVNVHWKSS